SSVLRRVVQCQVCHGLAFLNRCCEICERTSGKFLHLVFHATVLVVSGLTDKQILSQLGLRHPGDSSHDLLQKDPQAASLNEIQSSINSSLKISGAIGFLQLDDWLQLVNPTLIIDHPQHINGSDVECVRGSFDVATECGIEQKSLLSVHDVFNVFRFAGNWD